MRRFAFAALPVTFLLFTSACRGDRDHLNPGDQTKEAQTAEASAAAAAQTPNSNEQPTVADKQLPTATPVPDTSPVIQVGFAGKVYAPTKLEFAALAKVKVTAGGKEYEGVSLASLATQVAARADAVATIQGTRQDNLRLGAIRFPVPDVGTSTVLVMDESGHIALASSTIPQEQWLKDVISIALN